jgi:hypothetical protein
MTSGSSLTLLVETNALLAQFGQPLSPLSTLPAPLSTTSNPTTPSRSRSVAADDDDGREAAHEAWAPNKREEMAKRLSNLIEELVRTERSYLQRIKVLKQVSEAGSSCADGL